MPELPEVEIARENLESWLRRRVIRDARVLDSRVLVGQRPAELTSMMRGARVRHIDRRGKYLVWDLGPKGRLLAHLGMTGKFVLRRRNEAAPPAVRVALDLGSGGRLLFVDPRRFGLFQMLRKPQMRRLESLGLEPLSRDFTVEAFRRMLRTCRQPIKPFLLDQTRVAGLGNIHAAEALYRAGIHPARRACRLTAVETSRLRRAIRRTLAVSIRSQRAPEIIYIEEAGSRNPFWVYGREGERCRRCGGPIRRSLQGGRSSFFCPGCQPRRATEPRGQGRRRIVLTPRA